MLEWLTLPHDVTAACPHAWLPGWLADTVLQDSTVPYDWALAHGNNQTWGDAVDTKAWLDAHAAPNYLASIPGAGHVPFDAIPPCDPESPDPEMPGCWSATFFGFLVEAMELGSVPCPGPR